MSIKAIIFDLYGTLIVRQERAFLKDISQYYLRTFGESTTLSQIGPLGLDLIKKLMVTDLSAGSLPPEVLATFVMPEENTSEDLEHALRNALITEARSTKLLPGVKRILAFFQACGYTLGLVSNASTYHKEPLYDFNLARFFDTVVFSCDVGYAKPHLEIYLIACQRLGVSPQDVVFVGDSYTLDVDAPLQLGMQALHVSKSERHTHHIDSITAMGLMILENECSSIAQHLNTTPPLLERQILLDEFTLMANHHNRQCLTYICSGSQAGVPREFFLQRFLTSSSLPSHQSHDPLSIPVKAGPEILLLTPLPR